jgi:hypothetical protein
MARQKNRSLSRWLNQLGWLYLGEANLSGRRSELIRDKAEFEAHWTKGLERWFEDGVDTPGLVLIKVHANRIHCWDGENEGEVVVNGPIQLVHKLPCRSANVTKRKSAASA